MVSKGSKLSAKGMDLIGSISRMWLGGYKFSGSATDIGLDPSSFFDIGPPNVYYRISVVFLTRSLQANAGKCPKTCL